MKISKGRKEQKDFFEILPQAIANLKKNVIDPFFKSGSNGDDYETAPLRSEIFTEEQLEQHAKTLSTKHVLVINSPGEHLLKRLAENERILLEIHALLTESVKKNNRIVPAAEWLLDNFYLIEEQIYTAKKHLPKGYSKGLPRLAKGVSAGLPRVYDLAVETISHSDGHVNLRSLTSFIKAYQTVHFLKLGELWAIPIMLRLALLENLRRLSIQISIDISNKALAESWADQLVDVAEKNPKNLVLVIADMARSNPPLASSFVAELTRRLQEKGNALSLVSSWLEQTLLENGLNSIDLIQQENQKQAADQVSISNSISSLRFLGTTNWHEFVEQTSIVEQTLREDPAGIYASMDFNTRDDYRHVVEEIAKNSPISEEAVAVIAIQSAQEAAAANDIIQTTHVGCYLKGPGLKKTQKQAGMKPPVEEIFRRFANKIPLTLYAGGIIVITALLAWQFITKAGAEGVTGWQLWLLSFFSIIAATHFAVPIINWLVTISARPLLLPRMDFSKGIPDDYRSIVVIPSIISSTSVIDTLIENLEIRFLANKDANLCFALLTDFRDAPLKDLPEDELLLKFAKERIVELNKKYGRTTEDTFFLFHRARQWNARDKVWMGYERKRGKLGDLNALLKGEKRDAFSLIVGEEKIYTGIKYVITLDADTQLPRDSAWKMIATLVHVLNRPVYNEKKQRVTRGYTILQPRASNSLSVTGSSIYTKIHGNEPGTDPYTKAISDVYQDLFQEGSFIGKGIYEVDTFEKVLKDRFPENRILSHDLLEGAYVRAGLISDVQLYEEYPSGYVTDMHRRHRWTRGDWQIAAWTLPFVKGKDRKFHKNPLTLLSKWKIADNLRRSFVPQSLLCLLIFGWVFSPNPPWWTSFVIAIVLVPDIISFLWQLYRKPPDTTLYQQAVFIFRSFKDIFSRQFIDFINLPFEAYIYTNAILRTLWRIYFSRRNLLQWTVYANPKSGRILLSDTLKEMWFAPFLSIVVLVWLSIYFPLTMAGTFPFLALWFLSPFIAWYISKPRTVKSASISENQTIYLRQVARKIWFFFESFVGKEDNWLPIDNYQEQPVERIAHRTSPTNIGMSLLANLTAHDFGFITISRFTDITGNTLATMDRMEKYKGHLYNWYDTRTLNPLIPRYISTVDSGNLIGHLLTLQQGILEMADKKIISPSMFEGLLDKIRIIRKKEEIPGLGELEKNIVSNYQQQADNIISAKNYAFELEKSLKDIFTKENQQRDDETKKWIEKTLEHVRTIYTELAIFIPWLSLAKPSPKLEAFIPELAGIPSLKQLSKIQQSLLHKVNSMDRRSNTGEENEWLTIFLSALTDSALKIREMILRLEQLSHLCDKLTNIEYDFLYDPSQHLLTIGYNPEEHRRDNSYYDLLASEARLTTFVAIAQGKLPQQSWFSFGRQLTQNAGVPILLSWSGSMFEYLMPSLVMPSYENTLLDQTTRAVVQKQIEYGRKQKVPWGISESGYNMVDGQMNYQYRAFGVPGIGFKRGLGEDLVISPYSTLLALMVAPLEAIDNLHVMQKLGFEGRYGFYEAIDYTPSRLLRKQNHVIVRSFMAHHQGMSFLSLSHLLHDRPMQDRFASNVHVRSALLLLQERIPRVATFYSPSVHEADTSITVKDNGAMRVVDTPHTATPEVQLLSNGRYHVVVTNAGGGYSRWKNISLTRWREDATCDNWGTFCFIRNLDNNRSWSAAFQPSLQESDNYEAVFSQGRAEFRRRDRSIETHTEIVVSPEDDIELRRVHITNRSRKKVTIEITSYAEVVLNAAIADESHPAFSNLFLQTEILEQRNAILCTRRPRSVDEHNPWMFHLMKVHEAEIKNVSYETDREKFIGRGYSIHDPVSVSQAEPLSGTQGSVLDPIVSIQYRIVIEPYETVTADMIFGIADTKEVCNTLIEKYQDRRLINRVLELAWTHSQVILRQINAVEADAQLYARLASSVIFANASLRADTAIIMKNQKGQSALWSYAISGDLPIVLLQIEDSANMALVRQMVQAHAYWRLKGLMVDLVIWNEDHGGYRQELLTQILSIISSELRDQPGGIFIRSSDQIPNEDRILFQAIAHIVIADKWGTLEEQVSGRTKLKTNIPYFEPLKFTSTVEERIPTPANLQFFNGHGGFSQDGTEYVIITNDQQHTPTPWINVIANPQFGFVVSESGQSYTWINNAHEFRLTPWNNDPVTDLKGEAFYLRDEESGKFWSPTTLPCRGRAPYITRHGFGYSIFEHREDGIETEMCVFADIEDPVKFITLKVRNKSGRARRISVTGYIEWVLGDLRSKTLKHIITETDIRSGAILARNPYNTEMENKVAFFDTDDPNRSYTTDRTEFIGRNGTMNNPEAMNRKRLSGRTGAALDPCAALQVVFDLTEDQEHEVVFRLGAAKTQDAVLSLIRKFEGTMVARQALNKVQQYWKETLETIQVKTPDAATNLLTNGWLNYQTIVSRLWARSGFYQSGGAFGFRDQLQDVLSLLHIKPAYARQQILLCASRQFREGDVQHWWHPPTGRGVRTTCSDDYLWLPFATCRYVSSTGDNTILDESIHFLEGRLLNSGEESYYDLPIRSDQSGSLYDHCKKAVEKGLKFGVHGLPLIGSGDWNDGMDKVGTHGKGESVWLAFFLYDILIAFSKIAKEKKDDVFAKECLEKAKQLKTSIHQHAWDGDWYRRAYFDDGTPLGSVLNEECKIDSIAQSWSILSKGGDPAYDAKAMQSAEKYLVRKQDGLIQLFHPPFDKSELNPGYIKGYVPGVRENGGQYTHAAVWLVMAFAAMGNKEKTWELLKMINPVNHGSDAEQILRYKVEPYVVAADIYGGKQHIGRGGWTWYTGSAGWMYQLILESFIGFKRVANHLSFSPCFPDEWPSVTIKYKYFETVYEIELKKALPGTPAGNTEIELVDDKLNHQVTVIY